jgi:hypothetical protein
LRVLRIVGLGIGGLALAVLFAFLFGWLVMILWNWLMPALFGLKQITYWQGFGLVILAKLLFAGIGGHQRHDYHSPHQRWQTTPSGNNAGIGGANDAPERSARFREYWRTEGKAAFERFLGRAGGDAGQRSES